MSDLERLIGRISSQRANARDLVGLRHSLGVLPEVRKLLASFTSGEAVRIREETGEFREERELLEKAIEDAPPLSVREGGMIRRDFDARLKELSDISSGASKTIAEIQAQERERTGIKSLKISFNRVFGYYIEITKSNLESVPQDYIRKQTLANCERFITPRLKELEDMILGADEKIKGLEYEIFTGIRNRIAARSSAIKAAAGLIAEIDVFTSLAAAAKENQYARPVISSGDVIEITDGRHPVVERLLRGEKFVPNSILLDGSENQIALLTGPNMAGKSTFIRQVALIVLMAQAGSFVPAARAEIGIVDRIFTRVGASDDLAAGKSTFMVEMNETALILNSATSRSLIILDEIGRGTSTYDGISIAWSVAEYLHLHPEKKAKTLFATHYFELTKLEDIFNGIKNYNVAVSEWNDNIIFLRKIRKGVSDRSYGIHVARLAGLPPEVIERAKEILSELEMENFETRDARIRDIREKQGASQLELFDSGLLHQALIDEIRSIDIDGLTPMEAINVLHELIRKAKNGRNKSS
jgi:DNA mismatch repair protein MutS